MVEATGRNTLHLLRPIERADEDDFGSIPAFADLPSYSEEDPASELLCRPQDPAFFGETREERVGLPSVHRGLANPESSPRRAMRSRSDAGSCLADVFWRRRRDARRCPTRACS